MMSPNRISGDEYGQFLAEIKKQIESSRFRAASSLNQQILSLYWHIGRSITERQESHGWVDSVIDRLSSDLQRVFPEMKGFSVSNLRYMRRFFMSYRQVGKLPAAAGELSWSHNILLLDKVREAAERTWYATQALAYGWSKRVLAHQIESGLFNRQSGASKDHNFDRTLQSPQSDQAKELLKDPYHFDFLGLGPAIRERDLERALVHHVQEFLLELGAGFAFIGSQHLLEVGGTDYRVDLLFFHLKLRSLIALDLKMDAFRPEYAGKMNFYLSALDDLVRHADDGPSIGILLCKEKNRTTVEYSLRDTTKPIGVAAYRISSTLPKELQGKLPTSDDFANHLRLP